MGANQHRYRGRGPLLQGRDKRLDSTTHDTQFNSPVCRSAAYGFVLGDRLSFSVALDRKSRSIDAVTYQVVPHSFRASLRQTVVCISGTVAVGMASHFNLQRRMLIQCCSGIFEQLFGSG